MTRCCWKYLLLVAGLGLDSGAAEREIRRVFAVEPGAELAIDTYRGDVTIDESDGREITVEVVVDAVAGKEAEVVRLLEGVQVDFAQEGNRVTVVARSRRESGFRFVWREEDRTDLQFRISVPRQCSVDLRAVHGRAQIGNLTGKIKVQIETGGVFLRRIDGSVEVRLDEGDFILSRCSGPVMARVRRGLIRVGPLGGPADLRNATGEIDVMAVRHSLVAEAEVGEVRVGFAPGLAAESRVRVGAGNLIASFHSEAACRIDAAAIWGRVISGLPLVVESGADGKRQLSGRLNAGGPLVRLRASGGSVTLERGLLLADEEGPEPAVVRP